MPHRYQRLGISLAAFLAIALVPAAIWVEKVEPQLWQERLAWPSFHSEVNRHTPLTSEGAYLPPVIISNRTISGKDGEILLAGEVRIPAGVTVTVAADTSIRVHEYGALVVDGTLLVNGTATGPVSFATNERHLANRTWSGIQFRPGSQGTISYARIRHASPGITCEGDSVVTVDQTTVELGNLGAFIASRTCRFFDSTIQSTGTGVLGVGIQPVLVHTTIVAKEEPVRLFVQ